MDEKSLIFPAAEYQRRVSALQARMEDRAISALLLTTPPDVFYVTGFLTRFWESPARPWFVIVPTQGKPVAVIPSIGEVLMSQTWIDDIRTWDAPCPEDDGVTLLAASLREFVPQTGRVGLPMGLETHLRMPLADYARVRANIGSRKISDATEIVQRVREIKSEAEITKVRGTCRVADAAFAEVQKFACLGRPIADIFRDFQAALLRNGADWVSYVAGGAGRGGYGDVISPADDRPLREGDILMLDTGAVRDGYFCDFDRNFSIGPPNDNARRANAALYAATDAALHALKPGMTAAELHRVMVDAISDEGAIPGKGRLGHGLGLSLTEWPSLTPLDQTELREGMVLTLEPGVEIAQGKMMVHEENIVLRSDGPELLSKRAPAELPVIPA